MRNGSKNVPNGPTSFGLKSKLFLVGTDGFPPWSGKGIGIIDIPVLY